MKNIAVFGSTGSIGQSTLQVIRHFPGRFRVVALSANSDIEQLNAQIKEFRPIYACVTDKEKAPLFSKLVKPGVKILSGPEGLEELAAKKEISQIMLAISGSAALAPLVSAIKNAKDIALANKEALVMAGPIIMDLSRKNKAKIIPVDSEQSAIWQCLKGEEEKNLKHIYLTASGGPLRKLSRKALKNIRLRQVLKHPRWKMGKKITVDSSTLMNKGLELLEAIFLFNTKPSKIKVLVHPEALIHSMVEFVDGTVIAQLSVTDMRIPIQYALFYPQRVDCPLEGIDFCKVSALYFEKPDLAKFPCLRLAYEAAAKFGTMPCVLNAANEVAVSEFLREKIKFMHIPNIVEKVMRLHRNIAHPELNDIWEADSWARQEAAKIIARLN